MKSEPLRHDTRCRLCGSDAIATVLKLKPTPAEVMFVPKEAIQTPQGVYPLEVALCRACGYLHLPYVLSPELSYAGYLYVSKITLGLSRHYDEYAQQILDLTKAEPQSLVVDLGSNDGTMLAAFKRRGMRVLGVEPAKAIAHAASEAGIPTIADFFSDRVVDDIAKTHGAPAIITANYMYANIDDLHSFTACVTRLLAPDGVFVVQTGYHPQQMKILMFDYIYHEHFSYFTVKVLREFLARHELQLIDVCKTNAKGGSIRIVAQHAGGARPISANVAAAIAEEDAAGMEKVETFTAYEHKLNERKEKLLAFLRDAARQEKKIVGFGASHSTTTLTYHFELAPFLQYLVDDNTLKHGMYSPGYHLPVFPSAKLYEDRPEYVVVLAWQYQDAILAKNKEFTARGGKFVVPLPEFRVVG